MPNRMIKESIRTSKNVNALNDFQFRLWLYLITYVDDFGRGSADPELIKGLVFPRRKGVTENQIRDALAVLANTGMVILYEVDGEPYLYFPKWGDHQRIQTKTSKFPEPTEENITSRCSTVSHGESPLELEARTRNQEEEKENDTRARFSPPSLEDVIAYAKSRNSSVDPKRFFEYFEEGNWKDSKGNKVKNWKQKFITWENSGKEKGNAGASENKRFHIQYDVDGS